MNKQEETSRWISWVNHSNHILQLATCLRVGTGTSSGQWGKRKNLGKDQKFPLALKKMSLCCPFCLDLIPGMPEFCDLKSGSGERWENTFFLDNITGHWINQPWRQTTLDLINMYWDCLCYCSWKHSHNPH